MNNGERSGGPSTSTPIPNNTNNKGKSADRDQAKHDQNLQDLDKSVILNLTKSIQDFASQLSSLQKDISEVKNQLSHFDLRLNDVEKHIYDQTHSSASMTSQQPTNSSSLPSCEMEASNNTAPLSETSPNPQITKINELENTTSSMASQLNSITTMMNTLVSRLGFPDTSELLHNNE